jgi:hypothetical protein
VFSTITNIFAYPQPVRSVPPAVRVPQVGNYWSRQSAQRWRLGCMPYAPALLYPQKYLLVLISVRGWVNPRTMVRLEGSGKLQKIQCFHWDSNPRPSGLQHSASSIYATVCSHHLQGRKSTEQETSVQQVAGRIRSIAKSNGLIGKRTCDLSACSTVPQTTTLRLIIPPAYTCGICLKQPG